MEKTRRNSRLRIIAAAALFICAAATAVILNSVYNMEPSTFDLWLQKAFFSIRGPILNVVVTIITHCGDTVTIIAFCTVLLLLPNRRTYGLPTSLSALGGLAIYKPMKHLFSRARPDVSLHLVEQGGFSFPSGHSTTSIIVYGLLFYLIRKHCKNEKLRNILSALCLFMAVFIGPSRIYVGVHWPTDVLCGWFIGGGVLLIAITVLERMYSKNESLQ